MDRTNSRAAGRHGGGSLLFATAWLFVATMTAFDAGFAWHYRDSFHAWELNPLARRLAVSLGIAGLLGFKLGGTLFAAAVAMACRRLGHRLALPMTLIIATAYFLLSLHYAGGFLVPEDMPAQLLAVASRPFGGQ